MAARSSIILYEVGVYGKMEECTTENTTTNKLPLGLKELIDKICADPELCFINSVLHQNTPTMRTIPFDPDKSICLFLIYCSNRYFTSAAFKAHDSPLLTRFTFCTLLCFPSRFCRSPRFYHV
jgi:hypothetical protein